MDIKDLVIGEIYFNEYDGGWFVEVSKASDYYVKHKGAIHTNGSIYTSENGWGNWSIFNKNPRIATNQEKEWFNKCIKENKYTKLEDYIPKGQEYLVF